MSPASADEVFRTVSESRFGVQTGIFTKSMELAIRAVRNLRTGGVIINGSSTWRTDQLAYGGVKDSGIGREGPRGAPARGLYERPPRPMIGRQHNSAPSGGG